MRFRNPEVGSPPIRVPLLSGHVALIGNEWRELPEIFHVEAVRRGAEREDRADIPYPQAVQVQAGPDAMSQTVGEDAHYRQAITAMLIRSVDGDFTGDGLPNTNVVSKLCGFRAVKEDVLRVFRAMKAEAGVGSEQA